MKVTLPRVHFLERPYPDWWHEKIPMPQKRKEVDNEHMRSHHRRVLS